MNEHRQIQANPIVRVGLRTKFSGGDGVTVPQNNIISSSRISKQKSSSWEVSLGFPTNEPLTKETTLKLAVPSILDFDLSPFAGWIF